VLVIYLLQFLMLFLYNDIWLCTMSLIVYVMWCLFCIGLEVFRSDRCVHWAPVGIYPDWCFREQCRRGCRTSPQPGPGPSRAGRTGHDGSCMLPDARDVAKSTRTLARTYIQGSDGELCVVRLLILCVKVSNN